MNSMKVMNTICGLVSAPINILQIAEHFAMSISAWT